MPNYSLIQSTPRVPHGISCRYFLVDPSQAGRRTLLVVAFEGEYPDGSRGNAHGAYVATAALHGLHAFDADGVVLDFRGLTYRWGNTLLKVFEDIGRFKDTDLEPGEPRFPVVVVTSERCRSAFLSLVTPTGQPAPDWHFDEIDEAIEFGLAWIDRWFAF
ncbi:hypothetical protein [Rhizobacter sp. P5_C2]